MSNQDLAEKSEITKEEKREIERQKREELKRVEIASMEKLKNLFDIKYGELREAAIQIKILSKNGENLNLGEIMEKLTNSILDNKSKFKDIENLNDALKEVALVKIKNQEKPTENKILSVQVASRDKFGVSCPVLNIDLENGKIEIPFTFSIQKSRYGNEDGLTEFNLGLKDVIFTVGDESKNIKPKVSKNISPDFFKNHLNNSKLERLMRTLSEGSFGSDFTYNTEEEKISLMQATVNKLSANLMYATIMRNEDIKNDLAIKQESVKDEEPKVGEMKRERKIGL